MNRPKAEDTLTQPRVIVLRITLYILTLVLQIVNALLTLVWALRVMDEEPDLQFYFYLSPRFFSVWTIVLHIMNAALGLICFQNALNYTKKKKRYIINLRRFKKTFFCAIVWPSSWVGPVVTKVGTMGSMRNRGNSSTFIWTDIVILTFSKVCSTYFWFFYHYDKSLLKFHILMKIGYPLNNHIEHTFIVFAAVCEALLQSDNKPKSHKMNVLYGLSVVLLYIILLWYTYVTSGTWLYPFYDVSYGTIYFPLIISMSFVLTVVSYYAQWLIPRDKEHSLKKLLLNFSM